MLTKLKYIPQSILIPKIISYLELHESLSQSQKEEIDRGLCVGLSIVHAYMAAVGALPYWYEILHKIAEWDEIEKPEKISFIFSNGKTHKLSKLFELAINYIFFNQAIKSLKDLFPNICQQTILIKNGHFDSDRGKIKHHITAAGHFSAETLTLLLKEKIFTLNGLFLVHFLGHACSIRLIGQQWFLYDSNNDTENEFMSTEDLGIYLIQKNASLAIEIATWECKNITESYFNNFENKYNDILAIDNGVPILHGQALHFIPVHAPNKLCMIFKLANDHLKTCDELVKALSLECRGATVLHWIARYAPAELPNLLTLAEKNSKIAYTISKYLSHKNCYGEAALLFIEIFAPSQFSKFNKLAKEYPVNYTEKIKLLIFQGFSKFSKHFFEYRCCYANLTIITLLTIKLFYAWNRLEGFERLQIPKYSYQLANPLRFFKQNLCRTNFSIPFQTGLAFLLKNSIRY